MKKNLIVMLVLISFLFVGCGPSKGSLLPNKVDFNVDLMPMTSESIVTQDGVKIYFRYTGARQVTIDNERGIIKTDLGDCDLISVTNLDSEGNTFLNGQTGVFDFSCNSEILSGDTIEGDIVGVSLINPNSGIERTINGTVRLGIN